MAAQEPTNLVVSTWGDFLKLNWTPGTYGSWTCIERSPDGGTYTEIDTCNKNDNEYVDNTVEDGKEYWYRLRNYQVEPEGYSSYSNEDSAVSRLLAPSNLQATCLDKNTIRLTWNDNSQNEAGVKIYKNGTYLTSVGPNVELYDVGSLDPGTWYTFKVRAYNTAWGDSDYSNEAQGFTYDPPNAPSNLQVTSVSPTQLNLSWTDNSDNETDFHIEESSTGPTSGFSEVATVTAGTTTYPRTGLSGGTQYWYRVRAHNVSDYSAYCAVQTGVTQGDVVAPTNLQLFSPKGDTVELTFKDNSNDEDYHSIERKTGAGGTYTEIKQLEPNRTYYKDTGRTVGETYYYRVRAHQNLVDSAYCDEASIVTLTAPSTPTGLAISDKRDTWQRLTWNAVSNAQGYKLYRSTNGSTFTEYLVIQRADVLGYKVQGLSANTQYWYKISAYNGQAESSQSTAVNGTTDAQYTESALEKYLRKVNLDNVFLVEARPKMLMSGFTLTGGRTYTYEATFEERGADIAAVYGNGVSYTEKTSVSDVEANAASWYFDYWARKLYVHTSGGGDPMYYQIDAAFWIYFSNYRTPENTLSFNDRNYLPLLAKSDIPDVTEEVQPLFAGNSGTTNGSVRIMNAVLAGTNYCDRLWARYKWENALVVLKSGGPSFSYADFQTVLAGVVKDRSIDESGLTLEVTDFREGVFRSVPLSEFWTSEYPNLDSNTVGAKKPFHYGAVTNFVAVCVDATRKKWAFHDGRVLSVTSVKKNNGTALTENTDYFIDYRRGVIEFAEGYSIESTDVVTIDFTGHVEAYGVDAITDGAEVFLDFLVRYLGLSVSECDTDSIYYVKKNGPKTFTMTVPSEQPSSEIIKSIEQSLLAFCRQDEQARIGLKLVETTAPSNVRYVFEHQIKGINSTFSRDSLYSEFRVCYKRNVGSDSWSAVLRQKPSVTYSFGIDKRETVYTFVGTQADAEATGNYLVGEVGKERINFKTPAHLFTVGAGDIIKVTRSRFWNASGSMGETLLRVLKITKSMSRNECDIVAEVV